MVSIYLITVELAFKVLKPLLHFNSSDITYKIRDLNAKVQEIMREQEIQRVG